MQTLLDINSLELDLTNKCPVKCPTCYIRVGDDINNSQLLWNDILKNNILKIVNLKRVFLCGDWGEPFTHTKILEILKFFRDNFKDVYLHIATAGVYSNSIKFVKELKLSLPDNHLLEFAVDGLTDKEHFISRPIVGVNSLSIIDKNIWNAIEHNIITQVAFTKYKHNEHIESEIIKKYPVVYVRDTRYETEYLKRPNKKTNNYNILWKDITNLSQKMLFLIYRVEKKYSNSIYIKHTGEMLPCNESSRVGISGIDITKIDMNSISNNKKVCTKFIDNYDIRKCCVTCGLENNNLL